MAVINFLRMKLGKTSHSLYLKERKKPRNKPNHGGEISLQRKSQTTKKIIIKRNRRINNGKKCHVPGLVQLNCDYGYITKRNLQIQCNFYQMSNDILYRPRKEMDTMHTQKCMWTQETTDSQSKHELKEHYWIS